MNSIHTNTTSFEEIVNNLIKDIKITGLENIGKLLESIDQVLFEQKQTHMKVVKFKERVIQTTIGVLRFKRRYYFDEYEKKYQYLLDAFLCIPKRNRYMDAVKLKIIEAASEMSYEKAGRYACEENLPASKSTVCRILKNTDFYIVDNNRIIKKTEKSIFKLMKNICMLKVFRTRKRYILERYLKA